MSDGALLEWGSLGEVFNTRGSRQHRSGERRAKLCQSLRQESLYSW